MQFSSHSIELILKQFLNQSAEENPCCTFFPGAFNIKLVNSFILVWHSDYELSSKIQKYFFILKESSKCHNINYRAKNQVVMFCFGLRSIARFINTDASYFNTHRLESEEKFPETFKSQLEKNKNVIHWSVLGATVPSVLKTLGTVSTNTERTRPLNNIYLLVSSVLYHHSLVRLICKAFTRCFSS